MARLSILKIARLGHPVLLRRAAPVPDPTAPEIRRLCDDMIETMADAGGVGLAAPQVHIALRVIVFHVPAERAESHVPAERAERGDEPEAVAVTMLVNPEIEPVGEARALGWEGCLSIPGMRGAVPRWCTIRYRGTTPEGIAVERIASGFHARVVQHEVDHLDGVLYPMRMNDLSLLSFTEEWQRYLAAVDLADRRSP